MPEKRWLEAQREAAFSAGPMCQGCPQPYDLQVQRRCKSRVVQQDRNTLETNLFWILFSNQAREPAGLKHINKRRKRN